MEITTTPTKPQTITKPAVAESQKQSAGYDTAELQAAISTSGPTEYSGAVTGVNLVLSENSQQLAKSAKQQDKADPAPIGNYEQAQGAVTKIVSGIQNHPKQALDAYGNLAAFNFKALLA